MPLPWNPSHFPLMLAPMQGLTNRGLRKVYAKTVAPDVLFTEFVRVRPGAKAMVAKSDFVEALAKDLRIPLIVQVIGSAEEGVVEATRALVDRGVEHINVNMGCPFGRMTSILAGGGMFRSPQSVEPMLRQLRKIVPGSLSVKTRLGLEEARELFAILPAFEGAGIDFLVVHSRTVKQKYQGNANHSITKELVESTSLPIIANGDIRTREQALSVQATTGAKGLMLGRGAIADPLIFERIRGNALACPNTEQRMGEFALHASMLLEQYSELFCGEAQIFSKLREVFAHFKDPKLRRWGRKICKRKQLSAVSAMLKEAQQNSQEN